MTSPTDESVRVARYTVSLAGKVDPCVDVWVMGKELAQGLRERGAVQPAVTVDPEVPAVEARVVVAAPTEAAAVYRGCYWVAKALEGEPLHGIQARVTVVPASH